MTTFSVTQIAQLTVRQKNIIVLADRYTFDLPELIEPDEDGDYVSENRVIIGHDFKEYMSHYFMDVETNLLSCIDPKDFKSVFCEVSGKRNSQYFSFTDKKEVDISCSGEICGYDSYEDDEESGERRFFFHILIDTDGNPVRLYDSIKLSEIK